jgi:hypothetical protein
MAVNLIPEDDLRAALRPYRVDPGTFEAAVRERLEAAERQREGAPLAHLFPLLKGAAAFLPLQVIVGCKMTPTAAKMAPAAGGYKLLSYVAFPAISLFVLLGATVFSVLKIRSIRAENDPGIGDQQAMREGLREWWRRHKWGALAVFAATITLSLVGATWLMYLLYIISFGVLLYILAAFARLGLGNRRVIGQSCLMGLGFLAQVAIFPQIGAQDIHFFDPILVAPVFLGGSLVLLPLIIGGSRLAGWRIEKVLRWTSGALFAVVAVPLMAWLMNPILWPATPTRIKRYVESFAEAPFASASWRRWEIAARWSIESKIDPDFSGPRRLLAEEISGGQNPFVLGSALRVGLVRTDQLGQLVQYEAKRRFLLAATPRGLEPQTIPSLAQEDWVIRAAVLRDDLSPEERDRLEKRLHVTLEGLSESTCEVLETVLRVTQLLEVIRRPIDRDRYRDRVHDWLREFHSKKAGGFQFAGGFKQYPNLPVGSLEATSYAIELMEIYGIPADIDLDWVRSFLRPSVFRSDDKWIAAVALDRLNHLPGVTRPTWLEILYRERSLLAAMVLVGLCIYATLSSPKPQPYLPA